MLETAIESHAAPKRGLPARRGHRGEDETALELRLRTPVDAKRGRVRDERRGATRVSHVGVGSDRHGVADGSDPLLQVDLVGRLAVGCRHDHVLVRRSDGRGVYRSRVRCGDVGCRVRYGRICCRVRRNHRVTRGVRPGPAVAIEASRVEQTHGPLLVGSASARGRVNSTKRNELGLAVPFDCTGRASRRVRRGVRRGCVRAGIRCRRRIRRNRVRCRNVGHSVCRHRVRRDGRVRGLDRRVEAARPAVDGATAGHSDCREKRDDDDEKAELVLHFETLFLGCRALLSTEV